jgi:hypothetical protein
MWAMISGEAEADWTDGPLNDRGDHWVNVTGIPAGGKVTVNNQMIGGDLTVRVTGNAAAKDLEIEVNNNEVGGKLTVIVDNNPFLYDLRVLVSGNKAGKDIYVSSSNNAVSNLYFSVYENQACNEFEIKVFNNIIDYRLNAIIEKNKASKSMKIDISANNKPVGWPQLFHTMHVYIKNNHVVKDDLVIHIIINIMATEGNPHMGIYIDYNGAGRDMTVLIMNNEAHPMGTIDIVINDNASDDDMAITIQGNKAKVINITVIQNTGCSYVRTSIQAGKPFPAVVNNNVKKCMQQTGGDNDWDGLSDKYETMIGTDPNDWDTDDDGLLDGWNDKNHNKKFDKGERYGEIGDPQGRYFHGSIFFLVPTQHEPKVLCADIYVEIDVMRGQRFPAASIKMVVKEFERHRIRLHIDTGWAKKTNGGGQRLPTNKLTQLGGKKYLYLHVSPKQIAGPLNDFHDFKSSSKYFDPLRNDIFHYCIVTPYISTWDSTAGSIDYANGTTGISERPGDDFMISGKVMANNIRSFYAGPDRNKKKPLEWAKTFMHELGHNLDLGHSADADEANTVMYRYTSTIKPLKYLEPAEWSAIKPEKVVDTTD